jgi:ABC-type uncharacterized transport system permease subunit
VGDVTTEIYGFVVVALIMGIVYSVVINRTRFGFDLRATGQSESAAVASGVSVKRMIVISMLLSGAVAGLVGLPILFGDAYAYGATFQSGSGFAGIAIALLGAQQRNRDRARRACCSRSSTSSPTRCRSWSTCRRRSSRSPRASSSGRRDRLRGGRAGRSTDRAEHRRTRARDGRMRNEPPRRPCATPRRKEVSVSAVRRPAPGRRAVGRRRRSRFDRAAGIAVLLLCWRAARVTGADDVASSGTIRASIAAAIPIGLAGLGGLWAERAGVVNIGLEGMMILGTFGAGYFGYFYNPWAGVIGAVVLGAVGGLIHAVATVSFGVDHIVSGVAINIIALGAVQYLAALSFADEPGGGTSQSPSIDDLPTLTLAFLSDPLGTWSRRTGSSSPTSRHCCGPW